MKREYEVTGTYATHLQFENGVYDAQRQRKAMVFTANLVDIDEITARLEGVARSITCTLDVKQILTDTPFHVEGILSTGSGQSPYVIIEAGDLNIDGQVRDCVRFSVPE